LEVVVVVDAMNEQYMRRVRARLPVGSWVGVVVEVRKNGLHVEKENQQGHMMISDSEMTLEKFHLDSIQHHFIHPPPPQRVHRFVHDTFITISTTTTTTSLFSHQHLNDDNGVLRYVLFYF
jgi:hypothetical protein